MLRDKEVVIDGVMSIRNVDVYGIDAALVRAGYPMSTEIDDMEHSIKEQGHDKLIKRGAALGKSPVGHGDDKFLRQIIVSFDLIMPRYMWAEFDTYGFTVKNSQSTMHRTKQLNYIALADKYVDPVIMQRFLALKQIYYNNPTEENLLKVKANLPEGIRIGAGIVTNYAQLRTIYFQRKAHRLPQWREIICPWIKSLPYAKEFGVCD